MISDEAFTTQASGTADFLEHFFSRVLANGDTPAGEFINEFGPGQSSNFSRFILGDLALGVPVAGGRQDEFLGKIAWRFAKNAIDIIREIQGDRCHLGILAD